MKLKRLLIAGGNSTLLVWDCPPGNKNTIIQKYLGEVEQIGFVEKKNDLPYLNMMGGELCVNGTIALASQCGKSGMLYTSGLDNPVRFKNQEESTSIELSIDYKVERNVVLLSGIGFIYVKRERKSFKNFLKKLAQGYNVPAFGAILYKNDQLIPYVYVVGTDSLFKETACGSGSICLSILKDVKIITQSTGEKIIIKQTNNRFTVQAKVVTIPL